MTEASARAESPRAATEREHLASVRPATGREHFRPPGWRRRVDTGESFDPNDPPPGDYTDDQGRRWVIDPT